MSSRSTARAQGLAFHARTAAPVAAPEALEVRRLFATFTVTTTADVVSAGDGKLSLREAITAANATRAADTIVLGAGAFPIGRAGAGEDGNLRGDFDVTAPL